MKKGCIVLVLGLFCFSCTASTLYKNDEQVKVEGVVAVIGSMPFPKVGVRTKDNVVIFFRNVPRKDIEDKINKRVSVEGKISVVTMRTADHKAMIVEYYIDNPTIEVRN